jgi:hypothetical protein
VLLEIFGARLEDLKGEWRTEVKPHIHPDAVKKIQRAATDLGLAVSYLPLYLTEG